MKKLLLLTAPLFMMIAITAIASRRESAIICTGNKAAITVGAIHFDVLLAVKPSEWEQGLSGKPELSNDRGMLFLFPDSAVRAFWMKDMLFPLDIVWIDENWHVVGIAKHLTPDTYPQTFKSAIPIKRVLEITATPPGERGIQVGDLVSFNCPK